MDSLIYYFNPLCKHRRCSYDLFTCVECQKFTRMVKAGRKLVEQENQQERADDANGKSENDH